MRSTSSGTDELPELGGELLGLCRLVPLRGHPGCRSPSSYFGGAALAYALLSLTVVRMVPVAVSMIGARLDRPTTAFLAWVGPRGLASVVFALLAIEDLGGSDPSVDLAVTAVTLTVALSILLHGITAGPGGRRYVELENADRTTGPRSRRSVMSRTKPQA